MPANSVATKETAAAQAGSGRSRIVYFAFNLAISFQSPLRLTLQRAFATKCANFVEEDLKIWSVSLDSLLFLGGTLASKSRRNFVTWDDLQRSRSRSLCSRVIPRDAKKLPPKLYTSLLVKINLSCCAACRIATPAKKSVGCRFFSLFFCLLTTEDDLLKKEPCEPRPCFTDQWRSSPRVCQK